MQPHGFIHTMLDVKLVVLLVAKLVEYPIDSTTIYDLCFQDETFNYFDLQMALPEMVKSGHLAVDEQGLYTITEKGRDHEAVMEDGIAIPVLERVTAAVKAYNLRRHRDDLIHVTITPEESGEFAVSMQLDYERGRLLRVELSAPNEKQARAFGRAFHENAEAVYQAVLMQMLGYVEKKPDRKN